MGNLREYFISSLDFVASRSLGVNWEPFVWAWNIWMVGVVWILFFKHDQKIQFVFNRQQPITYLVTFVFFVAPISHFFGAWDDYLSFKFYSGSTLEAVMTLPEGLRSESQKKIPEVPGLDKGSFSLGSWGTIETGAPYFSSEWYFYRVLKEMCKRASSTGIDRSTVKMTLFNRPHWLTGRRVSNLLTCDLK